MGGEKEFNCRGIKSNSYCAQNLQGIDLQPPFLKITLCAKGVGIKLELTPESLTELLSGDPEEIEVHLKRVDHTFEVAGIKVQSHCFCLTVDAQGKVQPKELINYLRYTAADYAIPRSRLSEAKARDKKYNQTRAVSALCDEARSLFVDLQKTGEGGELLLYVFGEQVLSLPQAIAKMPLKTSAKLHYNGADGIHIGIGDDGLLHLYWGESKVHKAASTAIEDCFKSLEPYFVEDSSPEAKRNRDLQLLRDNADLDNPELSNSLRQYFTASSKKSKMIEYRGLALVGFDADIYSNEPLSLEKLQEEAKTQILEWGKSLEGAIKKYKLENFVIDLFFVPLPSAEQFRADFLAAMGKV